jgi:hypothetical protein
MEDVLAVLEPRWKAQTNPAVRGIPEIADRFLWPEALPAASVQRGHESPEPGILSKRPEGWRPGLAVDFLRASARALTWIAFLFLRWASTEFGPSAESCFVVPGRAGLAAFAPDLCQVLPNHLVRLFHHNLTAKLVFARWIVKR